jgi:tRNA threonylcarbamoyladenosine biosynthesis protein TsaE
VTSEDSRFSFHSLEPEQTQSAACELARVLPRAGLVVSLSGDLGAGKTHFVKGLAQGLGLAPDLVTSPTFAIVNEYPVANGPRLVHMDFYRLESEIALEEVGFLDLLAMGAVLAIEWGERFAQALPADRIDIQIDRKHAGIGSRHETEKAEKTEQDEKSPREIRVAARGPESLQVLHAWRDALKGQWASEAASRE